MFTLNEIYGVQNHEGAAREVFNDINLSFTLGDTSERRKRFYNVSWVRLNATRRFDDIFHQLKNFFFCIVSDIQIFPRKDFLPSSYFVFKDWIWIYEVLKIKI